MKWYEFNYNKPQLTMNQRLHLEYNEENFIYNNQENIHTEEDNYPIYDWEEDMWNLKMGLE